MTEHPKGPVTAATTETADQSATANGEQDTASAIARPRRQSQKRSLARIEALLNAADQLLNERDPQNIGVYDIANLAGVPPTSAYHFFPTKEAAMLALAERYLRRLYEATAAPPDMSEVENWRDYVRDRYYKIVTFFNNNLPARKLLIGPAVGSDIKNLDINDVDRYSERWYSSINTYFVMPYIKYSSFKILNMISIQDGVWMTSYVKYGYISESFAKEGLRAVIAYLETFLPDAIPLRDPGLVREID